jgi:hypothetical protein
MQKTNSTMNCPFYGRALFAQMIQPFRFVLLDSQGNQCAIITDSHAPCRMEIEGLPIDWKECPLVQHVRLENT